jgi:hypothetical protein
MNIQKTENEQIPCGFSDLFLVKVKQDANVISSISSILEKMQNEGILGMLYLSFKSIIQREMQLSHCEFSKIDFSNQSYGFSVLYENNIYIFKENLKIISGFVSMLTS